MQVWEGWTEEDRRKYVEAIRKFEVLQAADNGQQIPVWEELTPEEQQRVISECEKHVNALAFRGVIDRIMEVFSVDCDEDEEAVPPVGEYTIEELLSDEE